MEKKDPVFKLYSDPAPFSVESPVSVHFMICKNVTIFAGWDKLIPWLH